MTVNAARVRHMHRRLTVARSRDDDARTRSHLVSLVATTMRRSWRAARTHSLRHCALSPPLRATRFPLMDDDATTRAPRRGRSSGRCHCVCLSCVCRTCVLIAPPGRAARVRMTHGWHTHDTRTRRRTSSAPYHVTRHTTVHCIDTITNQMLWASKCYYSTVLNRMTKNVT